jgi:hypothetical protein
MDPSKQSESLSLMAEKYSLSVIYAFGSRSKEALDFVLGRNLIPDFRGSDRDIGVLPQCTVNLSVHQKVDLAADLEDLFDAHRVAASLLGGLAIAIVG